MADIKQLLTKNARGKLSRELDSALAGMTRGEVKVAEPAKSAKPPKEKEPPKAKKQPKEKTGKVKKTLGKIGSALKTGINNAAEAMAEGPTPVMGPTILSEQSPQEPLTGLTDVFDQMARRRKLTAKNLMG
jgi:hypothetical protein